MHHPLEHFEGTTTKKADARSCLESMTIFGITVETGQLIERVAQLHGFRGILYQKDVEIRRQRLGPELPHCQRQLTSMIGGMIRKVLHEMGQLDACSSKRKHFRQVFVGHALNELGLLHLDFHPFRSHCVEVRKCLGTKHSIPLSFQIRE